MRWKTRMSLPAGRSRAAPHPVRRGRRATVAAASALLLTAGSARAEEDRACRALGDALVTLTRDARGGARDVWPRLHRLQRKAPARCDDGASAEAYSELVVSTLARRWEQLPALARRAKADPAFLGFVLRHVDGTASAEDLRAVAEHARTRCPRGVEASLCTRLAAAATDATRG
jgi:hypothetical protein